MDLRKTCFTQSFPGISGFGDGVCHQEFKRMCDTDEILRTFRATGVLPNVAGLVSMPCDQFLYGDFSEDVASPLCEEVNRDHVDKVDDGDTYSAEGRDQASPALEKDEVENGGVEVENGGVKGEQPAANPVADA